MYPSGPGLLRRCGGALFSQAYLMRQVYTPALLTLFHFCHVLHFFFLLLLPFTLAPQPPSILVAAAGNLRANAQSRKQREAAPPLCVRQHIDPAELGSPVDQVC